jgi:hypothetical protein
MVQQLSDGNGTGVNLGQSTTDKIGFYGLATPIVQPTMTATAVTAIGTTTISQVATSGKWAFATSTAATALVTRVDQMQVDLENLMNKLDALNLVGISGL